MEDNETVERLRTKLSDVELLAYGRRMASLHGEITENKNQLDSLKKEFNARIAGLEAQTAELSLKVDTGFEYREVKCFWMFDWEAGDKTLYRSDDHTSVRVNSISAQERQQKLKLEDEKPK